MAAKVWGHRGASGYAPENTLEAFELAARQGAHGVELDVHFSRDGEIVVTHDEAIDRVSDGSGLVRDMTLSQLKRFAFNKTHPEYANARIPTLREVYELLLPLGLTVNVELKTSRVPYPGLEAACIDLAAKMGMTQRVLYSSFNHYSVARVKEIDPSLPCGLLYGDVPCRPWDYARSLGMDALHPDFVSLSFDDTCREAHALGVRVHPWRTSAPALRWAWTRSSPTTRTSRCACSGRAEAQTNAGFACKAGVFFYTPVRSRTARPASISPAQEGTNDTLPGVCRRPGAGGSSEGKGARGGSVEKSTGTRRMPRRLNSVRITRASGHTLVSSM